MGGTAIWVSGDLGVLQGPLDLDVLDPVANLPAVRRTFRWAQVHDEQLSDRVLGAIPSKPGSSVATIRIATEKPVPVRLDNPFFRFFIAIGVINPRLTLFTDGVPDPSRSADGGLTWIGCRVCATTERAAVAFATSGGDHAGRAPQLLELLYSEVA